jgi:hypothetical protein
VKILIIFKHYPFILIFFNVYILMFLGIFCNFLVGQLVFYFLKILLILSCDNCNGLAF